MNLRDIARKERVVSSDAGRVDQYADSVANDFPSDDGYADMPGDAFAGDYPFVADAGHIDLGDGSQNFGSSDPDQSEMRLSSGMLGFFMELLESGMPEGHSLPPDLAKALARKPHKMHVDSRGSDMWSARTDTTPTGPNGTRAVYPRDNRRRVIITNYGPGALYVGHDGGELTTGTAPSTGAVSIPAPSGGTNFSREFRTTAELWVASATGNNTVFDVQDEFDEE